MCHTPVVAILIAGVGGQPDQDRPSGMREALECKPASTETELGACSNAFVGCASLELCLHESEEGRVRITVSRTDRDTKPLLLTAVLSTGEDAAFSLDGNAIWLRVNSGDESSSGTKRARIDLEPRPCPANETGKIELLIAIVESAQDCVFIRNGREYSDAQAAKHLRDKWEWKKKEIASAREFIAKAATRSSASGEDYEIRVSGRVTSSAEFLGKQLDLIEKTCGGHKRDNPR